MVISDRRDSDVVRVRALGAGAQVVSRALGAGAQMVSRAQPQGFRFGPGYVVKNDGRSNSGIVKVGIRERFTHDAIFAGITCMFGYLSHQHQILLSNSRVVNRCGSAKFFWY